MNIEDLIEYENESTFLDFKGKQYLKLEYFKFIKDVLSMANADIKEEKYIIIGIKKYTDGNYDVIGINKTDFIDAATYQQIITENIEPYLSIEYLPFNFRNKLIGIFKISDNNDKPYMMKKDFGSLKKGDSFIRKGTSQNRLLRSDLDKILKNKLDNQTFSGKIEICFSENRKKEIKLEALKKDFKFPSDIEAMDIKKSIKFEIESKSYPEKNVNLSSILNENVNFDEAKKIIENNFESRGKRLSDFPKIIKLLDDLKNVVNNFREEDYYELLEKNSHKLNFDILNNGNKYIKDAAIELNFKSKFLAVSAEEIEEPQSYSPPGVHGINFAKLAKLKMIMQKYPEATYENGYAKILYEIGDLKHHINKIKIFDTPIRIVLQRNLRNKNVKVFCKIYGENLPKPFEEILIIKVI